MLKMFSLFKLFSKKNYSLEVTSVLSTWGVERYSITNIPYFWRAFYQRNFQDCKNIVYVKSSAEDSTVEAWNSTYSATYH